MRVGLVVYGSIDTISGGYLYDRKLVSYLRSCGEQVELISILPGSYLRHLLDNFSFRLPPGLDIVIEDELTHPSLLVANARRRRGLPVVSLVHNLHSSERRLAWQNAFYRQVERLHLRAVDGYIFNSKITQESVLSLIGDGRPYVLAPPSGDRLGRLGAEAVRTRLARGGPLRLLFLANVTRLKGLDVLLDALAGLPATSCSLDVAGSLVVDAAFAQRMQAQAAGLAVPVRFHGALDGEALVKLLKSTDAVVIPSYWEGFGIAYLEGMAFGLPAIGTTAGAIPHMIHDGVNGYLVAPGDSAAVRDILQRLANDRQLLERLSLNALAYFDSCPTWDQSGEMVRGFLKEMLRRPGL